MRGIKAELAKKSKAGQQHSYLACYGAECEAGIQSLSIRQHYQQCSTWIKSQRNSSTNPLKIFISDNKKQAAHLAKQHKGIAAF